MDRIPIITGQTPAFTGTDGDRRDVVQSFDFEDAGVILEVTPRVNASGRITLELSQEVTETRPPPEGVDAGGNTAFFERKVESSVTVQSGETLVIGGLISETKNDTERGIPFLKDMPVLGGIFRATTDTLERTELIVLLTPKAVRDEGEARAVTKEFRERLKELEAAGPGEVPRGPGPP